MASRGKKWSDNATKTLIELWGEENIQIALSNAKTTKHSSAVYNSIWVSEVIFISYSMLYTVYCDH